MSTVAEVLTSGMNPHDVRSKFESLLRANYRDRGLSRYMAKRETFEELSKSELAALLERAADEYLDQLDTQEQVAVEFGTRIKVPSIRVGNTSSISEGRMAVIRKSDEMFERVRNESLDQRVSVLRDVAKQIIYYARGKCVTFGKATFEQLNEADLYYAKRQRGYDLVRKKINEVQCVNLTAREPGGTIPNLDQVISFCDAHGSDTEDILANVNVVALASTEDQDWS